MTLPVINPRVEIAGRPILFECLVSFGPPELLRNFEIIAGFVVHDEPLRARADHASVRALADRHLRHVFAVEHRLKDPSGLSRRDPFFLALHLLSTGETRSLNESDFKSRSKPSNRCFKDSRILCVNALMIGRKAVRRDAAQHRVAKIFEVRACPACNLRRCELHPLDEVKQYRLRLLHCLLVDRICDLRDGDDDSVALERARFDRVGFDAIALIHHLVASLEERTRHLGLGVG
jgi:hypothetical protein